MEHSKVMKHDKLLCSQASCKTTDNCLEWLEKEEEETQIDAPCFCRAVKSMIVFLRRRPDRAVSDRFFILISQHLDYVVRFFSSRWLISVIDTYVDRHSEHDMRSAAMIVSTAFGWERFAFTFFVTSGDTGNIKPSTEDLDSLDLWNSEMTALHVDSCYESSISALEKVYLNSRQDRGMLHPEWREP